MPDTTCFWLARLKIKDGCNPNGLWNATAPVEFTCTIGLVMINDAVIEVEVAVVVGVLPVPPVVVVGLVFGVGDIVSEPVQSAFTVYVPVYCRLDSGVVTPVTVPSNSLPVPSNRTRAMKAVVTFDDVNPVPTSE